jgi:hypothetical protein
MQSSHYFAWKIIDAHYLANRIFDSKELIPNGTSNHAHVRRPINIVLREYGSQVHVPALDFKIFRRDTAIRCMPILIAIDNLNRVVDIGRNAFDKRNLILDGEGVCHDEGLGIMRPGTDAVHSPATGFNPDKIVSEIVQLLFYPYLARFANGDDTDYRRNPNSDSQNREEAAHLVSE